MYIYLEGAKFFAHHGVDPQETIVGANFIIDLRLRTDFTHAAQTDELKGTVSYADIYAVVKKEMKTPSKLLEHVCERIGQRLFNDFPTIQEIIIRLSSCSSNGFFHRQYKHEVAFIFFQFEKQK